MKNYYESIIFFSISVISFDRYLDVTSMAKLEQYYNGYERRVLGYYNSIDDTLDWVVDKIPWLGGKKPIDFPHMIKRIDKVNEVVYMVCITAAALGVCFSLSLMIFNRALRHRRIIKMSSPNVNMLTLLGCILCYGVIAIDFGDLKGWHCTLRLIILDVGFTLAFG